jgi:hypothetical protein
MNSLRMGEGLYFDRLFLSSSDEESGDPTLEQFLLIRVHFILSREARQIPYIPCYTSGGMRHFELLP